ncbi:hypothetical protein CAEBREN_24947 [Caenorhabditis brenneri]|uniref:Uncharacterized protein n=1 Tax=Caenorhabditis brenneri TaxID=135651 RepID=G0M8F6_CAEBE|nr:hypothetical protein CAEBREN_24947 [Caenorhabditis brenneri]
MFVASLPKCIKTLLIF